MNELISGSSYARANVLEKYEGMKYELSKRLWNDISTYEYKKKNSFSAVYKNVISIEMTFLINYLVKQWSQAYQQYLLREPYSFTALKICSRKT